jgi:hypothetical protein
MIGLGVLGMLCWVVMFLAGTDVWHFAGRPDVWGEAGPPYTDIRAFGYAFYFQFFILLTMIFISVRQSLRTVRAQKVPSVERVAG